MESGQAVRAHTCLGGYGGGRGHPVSVRANRVTSTFAAPGGSTVAGWQQGSQLSGKAMPPRRRARPRTGEVARRAARSWRRRAAPRTSRPVAAAGARPGAGGMLAVAPRATLRGQPLPLALRLRPPRCGPCRRRRRRSGRPSLPPRAPRRRRAPPPGAARRCRAQAAAPAAVRRSRARGCPGGTRCTLRQGPARPRQATGQRGPVCGGGGRLTSAGLRAERPRRGIRRNALRGATRAPPARSINRPRPLHLLPLCLSRCPRSPLLLPALPP